MRVSDVRPGMMFVSSKRIDMEYHYADIIISVVETSPCALARQITSLRIDCGITSIQVRTRTCDDCVYHPGYWTHVQ